MVLAVIIGIGSTLFASVTDAFRTGDDVTLAQVMGTVLAAIVFLWMGIFAPGVASGLITGAPQLGAGSAAGATAGVAAGTYSDIAPVDDPITRLGPPLSGDLGATMLRAERELGIEPEYVTRFEDDFRPNPVDEAERARRMREAALADEAARAPVFFQLQSETGGTSVAKGRPAYRDPALDLGSELLALASLPPSAPSAFGTSADTNLQSRKLAFAGEGSDSDIYNPHQIEDLASPYQVMAGTLIPASLVTGINSDLPGTIVAQVTQPVYDTVTGQYVLIPQGSRLIGRYQSEVSFGQDRALVTWDRIASTNSLTERPSA